MRKRKKKEIDRQQRRRNELKYKLTFALFSARSNEVKLEPGATLIVCICMCAHIYLYTHKWDSHRPSPYSYNKVDEKKKNKKKRRKNARRNDSKETHKLKRLFQVTEEKDKKTLIKVISISKERNTYMGRERIMMMIPFRQIEDLVFFWPTGIMYVKCFAGEKEEGKRLSTTSKQQQ